MVIYWRAVKEDSSFALRDPTGFYTWETNILWLTQNLCCLTSLHHNVTFHLKSFLWLHIYTQDHVSCSYYCIRSYSNVFSVLSYTRFKRPHTFFLSNIYSCHMSVYRYLQLKVKSLLTMSRTLWGSRVPHSISSVYTVLYLFQALTLIS